MDNGKINVCLLNDSFPPTIDGVANTVLNYANIIYKNHGTPTVITPYYPDVVDNYPFDVIRYPSLHTEKLISYRAGVPLGDAIFNRAIDTAPDILHSHCPFVSTIIARSMQRITNVPIVFTYHTKFDVDIQKLIKGKLLQESAIKLIVDNINACDDVWVVSHGAGENLRSLGYEKDYIVMENGVDFPRGKSPEAEMSAVIDKYGLRRDVIKFMFAGRMMWYKGIDLILDSLKALADRGYDYQMVFIGSGMDMNDIVSRSESYGIKEKCVFTGAITDRTELRALFSSCDMFLFPSTFDTNGIVVREAAACELPTLLIKDSCASEGIVDMDTGFLTQKDARDMTARLEQLLKDPALIKNVGASAQSKIYISWEDAIAKANDRYHYVIENYIPKAFDHTGQHSDVLFNIATHMYEIRNMLHYDQ